MRFIFWPHCRPPILTSDSGGTNARAKVSRLFPPLLEEAPMKTRKKLLWIFPMVAFTAAALAATRSATAPLPDMPPVLAGTTAKPHVIVRVVSRDHSMTVVSSPAGPRYSAVTTNGAILADGLTLEQLRAAQPALYREVSPGVAGKESTLGPVGSIDLGD
jgi:hypothetical protein